MCFLGSNSDPTLSRLSRQRDPGNNPLPRNNFRRFEHPDQHHFKGWHLGVVLLLACLLNVFGCQNSGSNAVLDRSDEPLSVNVIELQRTDNSIKTASYFGILKPAASRTLGFGTAGRLDSIVAVGRRVLKDQVIAEMDSQDLQEQKESLQERLSQAQTAGQVEQASVLQSQINAIDEQIQAATLTAPFDCFVEETLAFEGSLVPARSAVVRIVDAENLIVEIQLPRRIERWVQSTQQIIFIADEQTLAGTLREKAISEKPTGTIMVRFDVLSSSSVDSLNFGQTVEAKFNFETNESGYWIPIDALSRSHDGVWSVFVLTEQQSGKDGFTVTRKLVSVKQLMDQFALIESEFDDDVQIVANGLHRVVPGQSVEPNLIEFTNPNDDSSGDDE